MHLHGDHARNLRRLHRGELESPPRTASMDTHRLSSSQPRLGGRLADRVQLHEHRSRTVPLPTSAPTTCRVHERLAVTRMPPIIIALAIVVIGAELLSRQLANDGGPGAESRRFRSPQPRPGGRLEGPAYLRGRLAKSPRRAAAVGLYGLEFPTSVSAH